LSGDAVKRDKKEIVRLEDIGWHPEDLKTGADWSALAEDLAKHLGVRRADLFDYGVFYKARRVVCYARHGAKGD
jgi:hypothetical protein